MSSYSNHIKKMTAILLAVPSFKMDSVTIDDTKNDKVVKPKIKKNVLPGLTEIEKDDISNVNDFHEFIEGPKLRDDSEE